MERSQKTNLPTRLERQLAHLKIISRLLSHELHAQTSPRLTLSRDEIGEIQTSLDLFIEEVLRTRSTSGSVATTEVEVQTVAARVN